MGVGELLRGLSARRVKNFGNTNRAFYMRSLFLVQACRYLPEVEQSNDLQLRAVTLLFKQVDIALKEANRSSKSSKKKDEIDQLFDDANGNLEKYIRCYDIKLIIRGTNEYMKNISFSKATRKDLEATESLQRYSEVLEKEIPKLKLKPRQRLNILLWGCKLVFEGPNDTVRPNSILFDTIEIERTASLDILLHRVIEYATQDMIRSISLDSISLALYPQFYTEVPTSATQFFEKTKVEKTLPSVKPWTKVSKFTGEKMLHIVLNGYELHEAPNQYTNAWSLNGSSNKMAVRQRTPSNSLRLWDKNDLTAFPIPQLGSECSPTSSNVTLVMSSSPEAQPLHQYQSNSSLGSETTMRDAPRTLSLEAVVPELKIPAPKAQSQSSVGYEHASREPEKTSPPAAAQKANTPTSSSRSINNDQIPSGNAFISKDPITRPHTPASDPRTESPEPPELDANGKPLPEWKPAKHRRQGNDAVEGRLGVAPTAEKAKSKGFFARIFGR